MLCISLAELHLLPASAALTGWHLQAPQSACRLPSQHACAVCLQTSQSACATREPAERQAQLGSNALCSRAGTVLAASTEFCKQVSKQAQLRG